jgi:hypothetical protein
MGDFSPILRSPLNCCRHGPAMDIFRLPLLGLNIDSNNLMPRPDVPANFLCDYIDPNNSTECIPFDHMI